MTLIYTAFLVISFLASFNSEFKYSGAITFTVTLLCLTALLITGNIK